jgi:hypothetical protein
LYFVPFSNGYLTLVPWVFEKFRIREAPVSGLKSCPRMVGFAKG